jgi:hypothetical protein
MKGHQSNLVGMFLILDSTDHEHHRTGQIIDYGRQLLPDPV